MSRPFVLLHEENNATLNCFVPATSSYRRRHDGRCAPAQIRRTKNSARGAESDCTRDLPGSILHVTTSHSASSHKAAAHRQWQGSAVLKSLDLVRRSIVELTYVRDMVQ